MSELFLKIVNMSISAGWFVLAVLILRMVLNKSPKWIRVLLWGLVAVRLICPFSLESALSLIPSTETINPEIMMDWTPEISTGVGSLDTALNPIITQSFAPDPGASMNPLQFWIPLAAVAWITGIAAMLIYTAVSYILLRHKVATAVLLRNNIYQSEYVDSPFVMGIFKPKIYLPFKICEQNLEHVVAHEEAHIRRKDHWWKPFGFVLLALHWFNPLMWLGYILLCRDIELACDEKVIKEMDNENRADYTQALVTCSVNRRSIAACPLAFGEVGIKARVKSVMDYKKPAFWVLVTALFICAGISVCFLTDPNAESGFGIRSLKTGTDENGTPAIIFDYLFLVDGEDHFDGNWVTHLSEDDQEYTENGMRAYNGDLGKYRIMIKFKRTGPSTGFRKTHIPGQVYTLEKPAETFAAELKYKVVYPPDYSMVIYIGSDYPLVPKTPALYNVRYLGGKMYFRLYGMPMDDGSGIFAVCGENKKPILKKPAGRTIKEYAQTTVNWLPMQLDENAAVSLEVLRNGKSVTAFYEVYDAETLELLEYLLPTDTAPLIYLFRNAQPGHLYIVLVQIDAEDELYAFGVAMGDPTPGMQAYNGNLKTYYKNPDGTWRLDGRDYQYRLVITGRMPNAMKDSTFVYLSNLDNITFEQACKDADLNGDYFSLDDAILVEWTDN
jgi:beta-lactamase regulating signal transducer with metallopeptidase domain